MPAADQLAAATRTHERLLRESEAIDLAALSSAIDKARGQARAARVEAAIKGTVEAREAAEAAVAALDAALDAHAAAEEQSQVVRAAIDQVEAQLRQLEAQAQADRVTAHRAALEARVAKGRDQAAATIEAVFQLHVFAGGMAPDFPGVANLLGGLLAGEGDGFARVNAALARASQRLHEVRAGLEVSP